MYAHISLLTKESQKQNKPISNVSHFQKEELLEKVLPESQDDNFTVELVYGPSGMFTVLSSTYGCL